MKKGVRIIENIYSGERTFLFLFGYFLYGLIEIMWRGYTHWTMAVTGGICLVIIFEISVRFSGLPLWKKCFFGSLAITAIEFLIGIVVNIVLGWNVWDYTDEPFNILGQICPLFSLMWFLLCIPANFICRDIHRKFVSEDIITESY